MVASAHSQESSLEPKVVPEPHEFLPPISPRWGGDFAITQREPLGRSSGAARANGTAFIAVPDTGLIPNRGIVTYRTTNFGVTWSTASSVSPSLLVSNTKMIRGANDSLYLFFLSGGDLYCWNVETAIIRNVTGVVPPMQDFDVVASANGNFYAFVHNPETNQIFTFRSTDYGAIWGAQVFSQDGAHPRAYINTVFGRRDTLFVSYYSPVSTDTSRSMIALRRLRENNSLLETIDNRIIDEDTTYRRREHQCVRSGNVVWFFIQREPLIGEDSNIRCRVSTDLGVTFAPAFTLAGTSIGEYWFDAAHYSDGVDFIYVADSAATANDRLMYLYLEQTTPTTVRGRRRISDHPPQWSSRYYLPRIIEYPSVGGDVGVIWVGLDGATRKVFYDSQSASPLNVRENPDEVPKGFLLMQNYPNPFNPSTTIKFSIPQAGFVSLKLYDLLGMEVRTLVSQQMNPGTHAVDFDARDLASGVYLYRMQTGASSATRKLMLVR
ncbi:MAG: T9SS type A sorting domain-containing protein [Bacteroidetes bacterium]|nr:T9SS type A sorting domain-containing protein [Bacteroidota bacterium]MCW5894406.1 T9SS type A sorting domain-containing protein [Bacteroidota bacterium]